jgi:hypothetical protein
MEAIVDVLVALAIDLLVAAISLYIKSRLAAA